MYDVRVTTGANIEIYEVISNARIRTTNILSE